MTVCSGSVLLNVGLGEAAKRGVGTGVNQIPDMSSFLSSLGNSSGWQCLPGGRIEQWGTAGTNANGDFIIRYPIAFTKIPILTLTGMFVTPIPIVISIRAASSGVTGVTGTVWGWDGTRFILAANTLLSWGAQG